LIVIESFRHRGLRQLYERGDRSGIRPDMVSRVERILQRLDVISAPEQMNLPGWRLHPLKGDLKGFWSVTVNGNWRVIFAWTGSAPADVDFLDYH
jgi:toxin HigB-1